MAGLCLATPWFDTAQACWISDLELYIQAHPWYVLFAAKHLDHICMGSMLTQLILALFFYGYGNNYADDELWQRFVKFLFLEGPRFGVYLIGGFYALWSCTLMFLVFELVPIVEIPPLLKEYVRDSPTAHYLLLFLEGACIYTVVVGVFFAVSAAHSPGLQAAIRTEPPSRAVSFMLWFYRPLPDVPSPERRARHPRLVRRRGSTNSAVPLGGAQDLVISRQILINRLLGYQRNPGIETLLNLTREVGAGRTILFTIVYVVPNIGIHQFVSVVNNRSIFTRHSFLPSTSSPLQHHLPVSFPETEEIMPEAFLEEVEDPFPQGPLQRRFPADVPVFVQPATRAVVEEIKDDAGNAFEGSSS